MLLAEPRLNDLRPGEKEAPNPLGLQRARRPIFMEVGMLHIRHSLRRVRSFLLLLLLSVSLVMGPANGHAQPMQSGGARPASGPGGTASASQDLPSSNQGQAPAKRCCACVYREKADTPCESLDKDQCKSYKDESNPNAPWICQLDKSGNCRNFFQSLCESELAAMKCDWAQAIPQPGPIGSVPVTDVSIPWPQGCTAMEVVTGDHGMPKQCADYFAFLQSLILAAPGTCQSINVTTSACNVFQDTNDVIAAAQQLCTQQGIQCTISANQCKGVVDPESGCVLGQFDTKLKICVDKEGGINPQWPVCPPTADDPACKGKGQEKNCSCPEALKGQTQQCVKSPGAGPQPLTCCKTRRRAIVMKGGIPTFSLIDAFAWIEGSKCPVP